MKQPATAFAIGALSALAFQPLGWWPLMPLALAALCELVDRAPTLRRALLIGWLFGLGQFVVGLNWIATAFTYQAAMPAWLGWIAVVLLSLYLAVFPMLAAGLAWRIGKDRPLALILALSGSWALTEWLRAGLFTGFAWNPVSVTMVDTPLRGLAAGIGTYGTQARLQTRVRRSGSHCPRNPDFLDAKAGADGRPEADPHCPAQHWSTGQVASRLRRDRRASARPPIDPGAAGFAPPLLAGGRNYQPAHRPTGRSPLANGHGAPEGDAHPRHR